MGSSADSQPATGFLSQAASREGVGVQPTSSCLPIQFQSSPKTPTLNSAKQKSTVVRVPQDQRQPHFWRLRVVSHWKYSALATSSSACLAARVWHSSAVGRACHVAKRSSSWRQGAGRWMGNTPLKEKIQKNNTHKSPAKDPPRFIWSGFGKKCAVLEKNWEVRN